MLLISVPVLWSTILLTAASSSSSVPLAPLLPPPLSFSIPTSTRSSLSQPPSLLTPKSSSAPPPLPLFSFPISSYLVSMKGSSPLSSTA